MNESDEFVMLLLVRIVCVCVVLALNPERGKLYPLSSDCTENVEVPCTFGKENEPLTTFSKCGILRAVENLTLPLASVISM